MQNKLVTNSSQQTELTALMLSNFFRSPQTVITNERDAVALHL